MSWLFLVLSVVGLVHALNALAPAQAARRSCSPGASSPRGSRSSWSGTTWSGSCSPPRSSCARGALDEPGRRRRARAAWSIAGGAARGHRRSSPARPRSRCTAPCDDLEPDAGRARGSRAATSCSRSCSTGAAGVRRIAQHRVRPRRRQAACSSTSPCPTAPVPGRPARRARRSADPRRRLGHRRQARAGPPAAQPHGRPGLGRLQRQLPAQPGRPRSPTTSRPQAGARLDPRARRRVRHRPRLRLRHRRLGRRPPHRADRAHRQRPRVPAGLRGRRHVGGRPPCRSTASTTSPTTARSAATRRSSARFLEPLVMKAFLADEPEKFEAASPIDHVRRRRAAVLRDPRRPRHPGPGRGRPHLRRAAAGRVRRAGRSTPSCRAPSTPSRSSRRCAPPR